MKWGVHAFFCTLALAPFAAQGDASRGLPIIESGDYEVVSSNHAGVCTQKIRSQIDPAHPVLRSLLVTYTGDCYSWGPFEFQCDLQTGVCSTGSESIQPTGVNLYRWTNATYGIWAEFRRSAN